MSPLRRAFAIERQMVKGMGHHGISVLIEAAIIAAIQEERERCAAMVKEFPDHPSLVAKIRGYPK